MEDPGRSLSKATEAVNRRLISLYGTGMVPRRRRHAEKVLGADTAC
jgi:hypothetical protein